MGDQGDSNNKHQSAFIYLCRSPQSCPKTVIYGCSVKHTHKNKISQISKDDVEYYSLASLHQI